MNDTKAVQTTQPQAGVTARQEFGAQSLQKSGETAASAVAAQATAMIQSRYIMAIQRPRDIDQVRVRLLKAVERPGFAESAWYRKPVGKGVEGLSVRFAEEASRCMTNLAKDAMVTYEDAEQRIMRLFVTDLESNDSNSIDVVIAKTVERSKVPEGETAIRVRVNSQGRSTYLLHATDDDVLTKQQNLLARIRRSLILQLIPGDIVDECKARILAIRQGDVAKDPEGAKRKIADAFSGVGVMPAQLKTYLGHDLATCSPAEILDLRSLYTAIKTGETTWAEIMEGRTGDAQPEAEKKSGLAAVTDKLKAETPKDDAPVVEKIADLPPLRGHVLSGAVPDPDAADAEKEPPAPCQHRPLWRLAAASKEGKPMVCPDCSVNIPPMEILAARDAAKEK